MKVAHFKRYAIIALGSIIPTVIITIIFIFISSLSYSYIFSLVQLIINIVLLPVIIIGFDITMREFRKSQDTPDLDLMWEVSPGKLEKSINIDYVTLPHQHARLVVVNNGKAVAVWYVAYFDLPN